MKPLRSYLLATASSVALIGSAAAQPPAPYVMTWAGPYAGLNLGAAWNNAKFSDLGVVDFPTTAYAFPQPNNDPFWSPKKPGFTFGGQAGYNWQTGAFVYGVEGDVNWVSGKTTESVATPNPPFPVMATTKLDWMATARGRLGMAVSQVLLYGTGGVAFAHFADSWGLAVNGGNEFSTSQTRTGWIAGGGVEYMLARNWTVRAEALYADFGSKSITVNQPGGQSFAYVSQFKHTVTTARAALNWKW